jgi:hypothetical protein
MSKDIAFVRKGTINKTGVKKLERLGFTVITIDKLSAGQHVDLAVRLQYAPEFQYKKAATT